MSARVGAVIPAYKVGDHILGVAVPVGHIAATLKRITYNHYLRGFSVASFELLLPIPSCSSGSSKARRPDVESTPTDPLVSFSETDLPAR